MRIKLTLISLVTMLALTACTEAPTLVDVTTVARSTTTQAASDTDTAKSDEKTSINYIETSSATATTNQDNTENSTDQTDSTAAESEVIVTTENPTTSAEAVVGVALYVEVPGSHYVGQTLTAASFNVTVELSDGSKLVNPEGWAVDKLTLDSETNEITVSYGFLTTTVTVVANASAPTTVAPVSEDLQAAINALAAVDKDYWSARILPKTVYITIDDGPSSVTPILLDMMDKYGIKATWFVCYNPIYEEYYREIVRRGHSIAIHSKTHDYDYVYASYENWLEDYTFMYNYIVEVTGVQPVAYRFPGGSVNVYTKAHADVKYQALAYLAATGMPYFDWNVTNADADYPSYDQALAHSFDGFTSRNHPVFLCHDSKAMQITLDTLPAIIEQYSAWGYSFAKITADTAPIHQGTAWDY